MYISVGLLNKQMGVDLEIARFFVDRKVPAGNSFWKDRLLYIGRGNGYIFIPVYYDLLYRLNISKEHLLNEDHLFFMEQIMHFATLVETGEISYEEQLISIEKLARPRCKNPDFYENLKTYLHQEKLYPRNNFGLKQISLNRADPFLFILSELPLESFRMADALKYWYASVGTYLIMDDMTDLKKDEEAGEENCILDLGSGDAGFQKAVDMISANSKTLEPINSVLGKYFEGELIGLESLRPVN